MKTGTINYNGPRVQITGYLSDDRFTGDVVVVNNGDEETSTGEHAVISTINGMEINFEDYL